MLAFAALGSFHTGAQEPGWSAHLPALRRDYLQPGGGSGRESPAIFNPSALDAKQWLRSVKQLDGEMLVLVLVLVLVVKHHDGFSMWPSRYTPRIRRHGSAKESISWTSGRMTTRSPKFLCGSSTAKAKTRTAIS